jgi:hypothetical protein
VVYEQSAGLEPAGSHTTCIHVGGLPAGLYTVKIHKKASERSRMISKKVLILR